MALQVVGAIIFQPINRGLPLRCLEEKYGLSSSHRESLIAQERRNQKRLSLNITNGLAHDNAHNGLGSTHCQDNSQLRSVLLQTKLSDRSVQFVTFDKCGVRVF